MVLAKITWSLLWSRLCKSKTSSNQEFLLRIYHKVFSSHFANCNHFYNDLQKYRYNLWLRYRYSLVSICINIQQYVLYNIWFPGIISHVETCSEKETANLNSETKIPNNSKLEIHVFLFWVGDDHVFSQFTNVYRPWYRTKFQPKGVCIKDCHK